MHGAREFLQMAEKVLLLLPQPFFTLMLQKPVISWNNPAADIISPDACFCALVRIRRAQARFGIWVCVFEEFAQHHGFVERLVVVLQCRHETARVEGEQRLRLVVWVDFDVLVWEGLFFEGDPDALNEGAEPAGVEFEGVRGGVGLAFLGIWPVGL
jgi:hypothetical protein